MSRMGRPPGKPTIYWTRDEREAIRKVMDDLRKKMPHRTVRSIAQMMIRIEDGEFEE